MLLVVIENTETSLENGRLPISINIYLIYDPVILPLSIYQREIKIYV